MYLFFNYMGSDKPELIEELEKRHLIKSREDSYFKIVCLKDFTWFNPDINKWEKIDENI